MQIKFREHFFRLVFIPIIIIVSLLSFYRFFIKHDYIIGYEVDCNPSINSCFIGCKDDSCTQEYFYSKMTKYFPDLYTECGKNIINCSFANICLPTDRYCFVEYCNTSDNIECRKIINKNDEQIDTMKAESQINKINMKNL